MSDGVLWRPRLVGRSPELAALESDFRRAAAGEFRCVLMLADPGVGKSRLGSEFLTRNRRRAVTLTACANPLGETASFGVWAEALERHLRDCPAGQITALCEGFLDDLAVLLRSVTLARGTAPPREPPMPRLLEGMAGLLAKLATRQPVAVFLDDMHLADASSWEALGYLARSLSGTRILVLLAARVAELARHDVGNDIVLDLEQQGLMQRLDLRPLGPEAIGDLAGAVLGEQPPSPLADWLATRSLGNPLFALSLLQGLIDEGADFTAPGLRSLPHDLSGRIASRCKQLDEPALLTLDLLAAVGERVELADLLRLTGRPLERLSVVLDGLVGSRLLVEEERGPQVTYEIAHPLIRDAIYQRIGGARRRALHRLIGRSLLASGRLGAAAPHFARSAEVGDNEAIEALRDGVRQAEECGAYREALKILDALVELLPPGDARWGEVLGALSWGAEWVVDHRADLHAVLGIKAMRRIDSVLQTLADPAPRATVKFRLASFLAWGTGDLVEAETACAQALELFEQAGEMGSALLAANELAWIQGLKGNLAASEAGAREVAAAAEAAGERFALLQALGALGVVTSWLGHFGPSEAAWRRSMTIAAEEGKPYRLILSHMSLAIMFGLMGRIEEALPLVDQAKTLYPDWRDSPLPEWECMIQWQVGDFRAALDSARQAADWSPGPLSKRRAFGMAFAVLSAVEADQPEDAERFLVRGQAAYGDRDWAFYRDYLDYARGVLAWRHGRHDDAVRALRRAGQRLLQMGVLHGGMFALVELCQVAAECGHPEAARDATVSLQQAADRLKPPLYRALAAVGASWAGIASGDTDRAPGLAQHAVTLLADYHYPYWLARAQEALGHSAAERGQAVQALEAAAAGFDACGARWRKDRVIESLRRLGSAGRRAAAGALGAASLTRREREVAHLAAGGHTARQIADRLCIGERTVESHLGNVYAKLGISSKLDLIRRAAELKL
ncbi:MAG: ATP-binding protein [Pseudonocardiaceae bacterium]